MDSNPTRKTASEDNPRILCHPEYVGSDGRGRTSKGGKGGKKTVEVACDVEGIEEFQAAMLQFDSALQNQVHRFLTSWAADVKAEAMRLVPVKTGHLRSTIYATIQNWVVNIGADATYALFVELGTIHMRAQPFLYPSIQAYLPELEVMILAAIDAAKAETGL